MKLSKLLSATLALLGAFFIACGPASAQWQVPNGTIPVGKGTGTGFGSITKSDLAGQGLGWFIVGSAQYPTIQSAVTAAGAVNGGVVWVPCGEYVLSSGAIGLDARNTRNVRIAGPWSVNSGGSACGAIRYNGTGTAIDMSGSIGFELDGLEIVAVNADHVVKASDQGTLAAFARIDRSTIIGKTTGTGVSSLTGIGIEFSFIITSVISRSSILSYIGVRGNNNDTTDVSNVISIKDNIFQPGNSYHLQNASYWNVKDNTIEGGLTGSSYSHTAGFTDCFVLNLEGNDFDDPQAVGPALALVQSTCRQVNSKGNLYASSAGQSAIVAVSGTGARINSDGDFFNLTGTPIALGTGNCGQMTNFQTPITSARITGTSNGCNVLDHVYNFPYFGSGIGLGAGGNAATMLWSGSVSGQITFQAQTNSGTYNWNWPTTAGAANSLFASGGGGGTPTAWATTGSGVLTALSVNIGSAGSFVVNGGALGTPSSGTVTNLTGTASININGTVGATTPGTGVFTTTTTGANSVVNHQNATTSGTVFNNSAGASASAIFQANNGANSVAFGMRGTAQTAYGMLAAGTAYIYGASNFNMMSDGGYIALATGGNAERARLSAAGGWSVGTTTDPGIGAILANTTVTATTYNKTGATTVGSLPACAAGLRGARYFVTDANATFTAGIGAVVAAGGANNVPVTCDGTNWRIG